jgi:hypothetical protein
LADIKTVSAKEQRPVLASYSVPLLDSLVNNTGTMAVMTYALFAVNSGRNPTLVLTVPIVAYAVMRYKFLLLVAEGAEEPERILLRDPGIIASVLLWLASYVVIYYGKIQLFQ